VVGTTAFMDLLNPSRAEGVCWNASRWAKAPLPRRLVVEVDKENEKKDIDELDIEIPVLTPASTGI